MRFIAKTVPRLVREQTPLRDDMSPEELKARILQVTHDAGDKILAYKGQVPVCVDHHWSVSGGKIVGAYKFNDAIYHIVDWDENKDEWTRSIARQLRSGEIDQVSLTHVPEDVALGRPLSVIELSLCTGSGARKGSGVIR